MRTPESRYSADATGQQRPCSDMLAVWRHSRTKARYRALKAGAANAATRWAGKTLSEAQKLAACSGRPATHNRSDITNKVGRRSMKILVLGGDGYLGWPTALHLSECGHEVAVADNFVRRHYDNELGVESLVPIEPLQTRIAVWKELTGKTIGCYIGDLTDAIFTYHIIRDF